MSTIYEPVSAKEANSTAEVALKAKAHKWAGVWCKIHAATEDGLFCTSVSLSDFDSEAPSIDQFIKAMEAFGYAVQPDLNIAKESIWCWVSW